MQLKTMLFASFLCLSLGRIVIFQCHCYATPCKPMETTTKSIGINIQEEIDFLRTLLHKFNNNTNIEEKAEIRGRIIGNIERILKLTSQVQSLADHRLETIANLDYVKENVILNIWRIVIDEYEETFPQPYDQDFEEKKVIYDKTKFEKLAKFDLYEERRRQQWLYYCEHPPNKKMVELVENLKKENIDFDTFSRGIAKAHRLLSDKFYNGLYEVILGDRKKYFIFKYVAPAMRILLKQEDILDELIEKTIPDPSE